jgi:hypothetical protein
MKRYRLLVILSIFASESCSAASSVYGRDQALVEFGREKIFDGMAPLRACAQDQNGGNCLQCSAVRVESNQGCTIYLSAAHCFTNMHTAFVGSEPVHAYYVHPLYQIDPRRDIAVVAVKGSSSKRSYPFWEGEESEFLTKPMLLSGYGVMPDNTNPRQAGYVLPLRVEDGVRLEFKGMTDDDRISIHSTSSGDSGGGLFVTDKQGRLLLAGIHAMGAPPENPFLPSLGVLIEKEFLHLISLMFHSKKSYKQLNQSAAAHKIYISSQEMERKIALIEAQPGRLFALGVRYSLGFEAPHDDKKALEYIKKAADQGHARAQFNLGSRWYWGKGIPRNVYKAAQWWKQAADQGLAEAQFNLGQMRYKGLGIPQDKARALTLWRQAADQGHAKAQFMLGQMYIHGISVEGNYTKAWDWLRKAANQGHAEAQYYLSHMYAYGNGVAQDMAMAVKWGRQSKIQDDKYMRKKLNIAKERMKKAASS